MKTIIDNVDVSKCKYFVEKIEEDNDVEIVNSCIICFDKCEKWNCYYKQLQKALQDIEAYKLESNEAAEIIAELEYKNEELKKKLEK